MNQIFWIGMLFLFLSIVVSIIIGLDDIKNSFKMGVIIGIAIDILLFIVYMIDKTKEEVII